MDEPPPRKRALLRQLVLWGIGIAIVIAVATRVPLDAFRSAIGKGPHLALASIDLVVALGVLVTDTISTWIGLVVVGIRWPLRRVLAIRGATYLLALLNYAVGQVGLGYYLHRSGTTTVRAIGVTLFLTGTTFATLLVLTTATWSLHGAGGTMWWTLVGGCVAFAVYLAVIAIAPAVLTSREILQPLFAARISGHAIAVAGRVPHVALLVLGYWFAMRVWGLEVPFVVAVTVMPAVVIATVLPISPAGLGTAQAAMVYLYSDYATGATAADRSANVLAFAIVHFVYAMIWQVLIGICFAMVLKRQDRAAF